MTSWQVRGQHGGPHVQHREQIRRPPRHRAPETASQGKHKRRSFNHENFPILWGDQSLILRSYILTCEHYHYLQYAFNINISTADLKSWQRVARLPGSWWLCESSLRVRSVKTSLRPLMGHQWCTGDTILIRGHCCVYNRSEVKSWLPYSAELKKRKHKLLCNNSVARILNIQNIPLHFPLPGCCWW